MATFNPYKEAAGEPDGPNVGVEPVTSGHGGTMITEATPGALGSNDQLGPSPERGAGLDALLYRLKNATENGQYDSLYLEAAAVIERQRAALLDANQICRSAWQIANRIATEYSTNEMGTYFGAFSERAHESLKRQHDTILATGWYPGLEA